MVMFNFEVFFIVFGLVFLAELGDKTQLMVIALASRENTPLKVGIATSIGISLVAIIGIALGLSVALFIPIIWIKLVGVVVFFVFGGIILLNFYKNRKKGEIEEESEFEFHKKSKIKVKNVFLFSMLSVFLMEFGDKTQIMTITLTANYASPLEVGLGAVLSLCLLCFIGAFIGGFISKKLPRKWIELGTGIFFFVMGVLLLIEALLAL
ncbi:MAG: TMEM165/GDT1 family protein [Candidatus Helarchaeota archaeon]